MKFGLMFFASSEDALTGNRYRVVTESARFADRNGFSSIWVPERHFTKFGSLYPNPAVLHSALAMITERIRLNAGSVVAPLHNPLRIAEEWAMVDNLSGGRVGVSLASGWNPADFAFFPDRYQNRQETLLKNARAIQRLWRGETTTTKSGTGEPVEIRIYPSPVQPELPLWLTAAGNPKTYALAGELGANLLTHLLDQDEEQLAGKLAGYRQARADHGWDPDAGIVTVMLHAYVGADADLVREQARVPFCQFIKSNIGLLKGLSQSRGQNVDVSSMPAQVLDEFVNFLYERFAAERGLIGTPESCFPLVERLHGIGVNEVAGLLDFGPEADLILSNLPHLSRLKDLCQARLASVKRSASPQLEEQTFSVETVQARCPAELSGAEFNEQLRSYGVEIEGGFKAIERIWRRDGEALGRIQLPQESSSSADVFTIHPAFLDACSRVLVAALPEQVRDDIYLPVGIRSLQVLGPAPVAGWSHATTKLPAQNVGPQKFVGDVDIYDLDGRLVIRIQGLRLEAPVLAGVATEERLSGNHSLIYKRRWIEKPAVPDQSKGFRDAGEAAGEKLAGKWMILADGGEVGLHLATLLREAGAECVLVLPDACDWTSSEAVRVFIARESPQQIVHLAGLAATPAAETTAESLQRDQELVCGSALHIIQAAAREPAGNMLRLYFVTKGAVARQDGEAAALAQAPLWGLAQSLAVEYPARWGGIVDLDAASPTPDDARQLFEWLQQPDGEDRLALRAGRRYAARLQRDESAKRTVGETHFDANATYLITGGLGGLGLEVARWLAKRGAGNLALVARREPGADTERTIRQLEQCKVRVRVFQADVSQVDELSRVIAGIESTMPPLKGVFHLAGVLDDALLGEQDWQRFRAGGVAKIEGAWNLHQLTENAALEFFVLFSSMAALVTMPGQGNYAAANSFLDALAHYRRSLGKPALSVNWGPWSRVGHGATEYGRNAHRQLAQLGIDSLAPHLNLQFLETLLGQRETQAGVVLVNWSRVFEADPATALSPLLSEQVRQQATPVLPAVETEFLLMLGTLSLAERREALNTFLSDLICKALKLRNGEAPTLGQGLFAMGLDSILALQLRAQLEASLGRSFRATLFFTYPNIASLTDYLLSELRLNEPAPLPNTDTLEIPGDATGLSGEALSLDSMSEEEIANLIAQEIGCSSEVVSGPAGPFDHSVSS